MYLDETQSIEEVRAASDAWKRAVRSAPFGSMPIAPPMMPRYVRFSGVTYDMTITFHATLIWRIVHQGDEISHFGRLKLA
jgi:hypothetical protein